MGVPQTAAELGWDFSCADWWDRLRRGDSLIPDLPLDAELADYAVKVFDNLRLPDVPGNPKLAEAAGDWSRDIVRALFGSIDRRSGIRRVSEIFELVPKKQSKTTTNGAGVMLTALILNERPKAEFLLIGPTQAIAERAFEQCEGMIALDPYLARRFKARPSRKLIECLATGAKLRIITFDANIATGSKPVGVLIDELHLMGPMAKAGSVIGQLRGGQIAAAESFLIFITTQSDNAPTGVFKDELERARKIRDGRLTGRGAQMLPVLYEFPREMQLDKEEPWRDPKLWPLVMPNLGRSVALDTMVEKFEEADAKGEHELRRWASQHLNLQIGLALSGDRWRGADLWPAAEVPDLRSLSQLLERSEVVTIGVDGGGLDDLFGLAVIGREIETRRWLMWAHAWAHPEVLERRQAEEARFREFAKLGQLTICEDATQDLREVADLASRARDAALLPEKRAIGLDPHGVAELLDELLLAGFDREQITAVPQGFRLQSAIVGLERKLKDKTAVHGGLELMSWCIGNAKVEPRGNAQMISKAIAGRGKIDPLIATLNAAKLMELAPEAAGAMPPSPWEDEEFVFVS
jgi:phage terminase large subunit-like protein